MTEPDNTQGAPPPAEGLAAAPPNGAEAYAAADPNTAADLGAMTEDAAEPDDAPTELTEEDPSAVLQRERDEYLDALQRKQAEFDNFRRRTRSEAAHQRILGHAEVAERMLDVLDDFDRTLQAAGEVEPGFLKGVELVHDKLRAVLNDFGLERIEEEGADFDPNRHEAIQQQPATEERSEPIVASVLRPGYELGGRVLRAAMVVVEQ